MGGLCTEYLLAKGWSAPAISMLQTVVDPKIKGTAVAMFMFVASVISSFAAVLLGNLIAEFDYSPEETPAEYGNLLAAATILPCILSMPCFLIAGFRYRAVKNAQIAAEPEEQRGLTKFKERVESQFDVYGGREFDHGQVRTLTMDFLKFTKPYNNALTAMKKQKSRQVDANKSAMAGSSRTNLSTM